MIMKQIMYRCSLFWSTSIMWLRGVLTCKLSEDERMSVISGYVRDDKPYKAIYKGSYLGFVKWVFTEPFDFS